MIKANFPAPQVMAPRAPSPPDDSFDLAHIDTPVEAMLMPVADMVTGMLAGGGPVTVIVQASGQKLQYTLTPSGSGTDISGFMNDKPFSLTAQPAPDGGMQVQGDTPGGAITEKLSATSDGYSLSGQAGSVPFQETLSTNPHGAIATVQGTVGSDSLQETLLPSPDSDSYSLTGTLGKHPIDLVIEQIAVGTVRVSGSIGALTIEELIAQGDGASLDLKHGPGHR